MKILIEELKALSPEVDGFDAKFKVLTENVEHHIEEEEDEMLPHAKKKLGDEIDEIGHQLDARKQELLAATPG